LLRRDGLSCRCGCPRPEREGREPEYRPKLRSVQG
jgi:hypothetical protein